jgi:hypothetical protein
LPTRSATRVGRLRLPRPRSSIPHAHLQRMSTKKIDLVVMNIDVLAFASFLFPLRRLFQQLSFKFRLVLLPFVPSARSK